MKIFGENEKATENINIWRHLQGTKKEFHAAREVPTFGEVSPEGEGVRVIAEIEF